MKHLMEQLLPRRLGKLVKHVTRGIGKCCAETQDGLKCLAGVQKDSGGRCFTCSAPPRNTLSLGAPGLLIGDPHLNFTRRSYNGCYSYGTYGHLRSGGGSKSHSGELKKSSAG